MQAHGTGGQPLEVLAGRMACKTRELGNLTEEFLNLGK